MKAKEGVEKVDKKQWRSKSTIPSVPSRLLHELIHGQFMGNPWKFVFLNM